MKPDDFTVIKANWEPKSLNIEQTAKELNLLPESIVFVDDNPAEREIVKGTLGCEAPPMESIEHYIQTLDKGGYFEVTNFSEDDLKRGEMYKQNAERAKMQSAFADYGEYLDSLEMRAEIVDFSPINLARITQLTNKSNQFNLTTKRFTPAETERVYQSPDYIRLCGRLSDKFGDNGIVSVNRYMELAMLDALAGEAAKQGVEVLRGHYYPTAKNNMVKNLYGDLGFEKLSEDGEGNALWELDITGYQNKNKHIKVN